MRGLKIQAGEGSRLYPSGSSQTSGAPPIPPFTDFVLSAGLFNLNPVGYSGGNAFRDGTPANAPFLTTAPYLPDYSGVTDFNIDRLYDQSALGNRFDSGTGSPTLQLTNPTVVAGAGTAAVNGTYTPRGLWNGRYVVMIEGQEYINPGEGGQSVFWTGTVWSIELPSGGYYYSLDDVQYPWQVTTWLPEIGVGDLPVPTVTQGTPGTAIINFDGVDDQLVTQSNVFAGGSQQGTIYLYFKDGGQGGGTVFATNANGTNNGVFIFTTGSTIAGQIESTNGKNSQELGELAEGWHFVAFGFDTTLSPETQTVMYVDGVLATQTSNSDINDELIGDFLGYLGVDADSNVWAGNILNIAVKNVLDTPTQMEAMRLYVESIPK